MSQVNAIEIPDRQGTRSSEFLKSRQSFHERQFFSARFEVTVIRRQSETMVLICQPDSPERIWLLSSPGKADNSGVRVSKFNGPAKRNRQGGGNAMTLEPRSVKTRLLFRELRASWGPGSAEAAGTCLVPALCTLIHFGTSESVTEWRPRPSRQGLSSWRRAVWSVPLLVAVFFRKCRTG